MNTKRPSSATKLSGKTAARNNRAAQLNPNNLKYYKARGISLPAPSQRVEQAKGKPKSSDNFVTDKNMEAKS